MEPVPLYPILDWPSARRWAIEDAVRAFAELGCRWVQLRGKTLAAGAFYEWARAAVAASEGGTSSIIVNDRADVAAASGAAGVHVGQEDLSVEGVRTVLGVEAIVGLSTHDVEQARRAEALPVDYVAIGPVFATTTKRSPYPPLGPDGVAAVRRVVTKPLVAIGGITAENGRRVLEAGADALAVIGALAAEDDPGRAARRLLAAWTGSPGSEAGGQGGGA